MAIDGHYYSVPYTLIKKEVEVRITHNTIECFYRGNRIASHRRSDQKGRHTTVAAHMPESHRQAGEWSPERLITWAAKTGPATEKLIRTVLGARNIHSRPTGLAWASSGWVRATARHAWKLPASVP